MTPRLSVRAAARENYMRMAREQEAAMKRLAEAWPSQSSKSTPTPDPSARLASARGGGEESLMTRLRALYEDSAVAVREIALIAGVTERTLYKYIAKGDWTRRNICKARDNAVAAANRGRHWQRGEGHPIVKGAGGRFIPRADAGNQVVHGIKALDTDGRARAAAACAAASQRHAKAKAKADAAQVWDARRRAIDAVSAAMASYVRWRKARDKRAGKAFNEGGFNDAERADNRQMEALFLRHIEVAVASVQDRSQ